MISAETTSGTLDTCLNEHHFVPAHPKSCRDKHPSTDPNLSSTSRNNTCLLHQLRRSLKAYSTYIPAPKSPNEHHTAQNAYKEPSRKGNLRNGHRPVSSKQKAGRQYTERLVYICTLHANCKRISASTLMLSWRHLQLLAANDQCPASGKGMWRHKGSRKSPLTQGAPQHSSGTAPTCEQSLTGV